MIRFWNTYLIPSKPNIYGKIERVNGKLEEWSKDTDTNVICLQEVFKWRVGILSTLIFIPLSKLIRGQSTSLLGITVYDGRYQISNIIVTFVSLYLLYKRQYKTLTLIVLCTLIQNIFFSHFDTLKSLIIPKEYKYKTRSEKDFHKTLLDGGQVTLSKIPFISTDEINFKESFEGLENSCIKTVVNLNDEDISIYNLHLAPTFGVDTSREKTNYGTSIDATLQTKIDSAASASKSIRVAQINELLSKIDSDRPNLVLGDFNTVDILCKRTHLNADKYIFSITIIYSCDAKRIPVLTNDF